MKNWGNWTYGELKNVIEEAKRKGEKSVSIDQEHTDFANDKQVEGWLSEMNLKYKSEMERTIIYLS